MQYQQSKLFQWTPEWSSLERPGRSVQKLQPSCPLTPVFAARRFAAHIVFAVTQHDEEIPQSPSAFQGRRCKMRRQRDECGIITIIILWTEEIVLRCKYFIKSVLSVQEDSKEAVTACQDKPGPMIIYALPGPDGPLLFSYIIQTWVSVLQQTPTPPFTSKSTARASQLSSKSPDKSLRGDQLL